MINCIKLKDFHTHTEHKDTEMDRHKMYPSLAQISLRYMVLSQLYGWDHSDIVPHLGGTIPARIMYHCAGLARVKGWIK